MLTIDVESPDGSQHTHRVDATPCRIGRGRECELPLAGWRVARVHAEIHAIGRVARIVDAGTLGGTLVNGERVAEYGPLTPADLVEIGGHRLRIRVETDDAPASGPMRPPASVADATAWRRLVHRELLRVVDLRRRDLRHLEAESLRVEVRALVERVVAEAVGLPAAIDRGRLVAEVLDEAVGLGPLEPLLGDASIGEIMVNAADEIWVERDGRLQRHAAAFSDDDAVRSVIDRIVAPLGRRIDEASPMVDARLSDGSRVNAIIPPIALRGPAITIRRFNRRLLRPEDLVTAGSASAAMLAFLEVCVAHRRNLVISGGTGSGKTTLLNLLANLVPSGERIVTIEDAAELTLNHPHLVQLEGRPPNLEQRGEVTIRDLVRNALRMRPDRIVVGECRGGEALDMLQAMNTGHDGSLTTVHANGPRDVVSRLEVMTLMAGMELPVQAIREQIASAVDVIVHVARFADGRRRITAVVEVTGIEAGRVQMQPIFEFRARHGRRADAQGGDFVACDAIPSFYEGLRAAGVELDLSPFLGGAPPWGGPHPGDAHRDHAHGGGRT